MNLKEVSNYSALRLNWPGHWMGDVINCIHPLVTFPSRAEQLEEYYSSRQTFPARERALKK